MNFLKDFSQNHHDKKQIPDSFILNSNPLTILRTTLINVKNINFIVGERNSHTMLNDKDSMGFRSWPYNFDYNPKTFSSPTTFSQSWTSTLKSKSAKQYLKVSQKSLIFFPFVLLTHHLFIFYLESALETCSDHLHKNNLRRTCQGCSRDIIKLIIWSPPL